MTAYTTRVCLLLAPGLLLAAFEARGYEATLRECATQTFPFVFLNVEVTDGGAPVPDLTAGNFACTESGDLQTEFFDVTPPDQSGGVRLADIVFLIDTSGSMGPEIMDVRDNVIEFTDRMTASGVDFRLGLVEFGQASGGGNPFCHESGVLTDDAERFKTIVGNLTPTGSIEPGFAALRLATDCFSLRPGSQRHFILVTDEDSDDRNKQATIDLMLANDVEVHTHADCNFVNSNADYCDPVVSVRGATGGLNSPVTTPFDAIAELIESRIASTYVLTYRSSNPSFDGTTRDIECTVSNGSAPASVSCSYVPGEAPRIVLTPETEALLGTSLAEGSTPVISVLATDTSAPLIQSVTLSVRTTGSGAYQEIAMTPVGGDRYEAAISPVATPGVDFFVKASDGVLTSSLPSTDPGLQPFQISVLPNEAPSIAHTPVPTTLEGAAIVLEADIVDTTNALAGAEVRWRRVGELLYAPVPMVSIGGNRFRGTIPGSEVTAGIQYYLRAEDDLGVGSTDATPDDPHVVGLVCGGRRIPEQVTGFGSCDALGAKPAIWGQFGDAGALVADSGERLQIRCEDFGGGRLGFRLYYTRPGRNELRVAVSPYESSCNVVSFYHGDDLDGNGQPDCLLNTQWTAKDYGANDRIVTADCLAGRNPWTGECDESVGLPLLDHAISKFDTNTNNVEKLNFKFHYDLGPPAPAGACSDPRLRPEGPFAGSKSVDPQLGDITEAFFEEVEQRLQEVPEQGAMQEGADPLCDYDADGDCDPEDIAILEEDIGKSVGESQCGAPCDLDGDGSITEDDKRALVLLCTDPEQCNQPPVAHAGEDQTPECTSEAGAVVLLDGSGSQDPDSTAGTNDDIVRFEWLDAAGASLGEGDVLEVQLPLGRHPLALRVTDSFGEVSEDGVVVTVRDTTAPEVALHPSPPFLWPPNHRMVPVEVEVSPADVCDPEAICAIAGVASSESGRRNRQPLWEVTGDLSLDLRSEREGGGPGRTYTIEVACVDASGNTTATTTEVVVPHDQGQAERLEREEAEREAAERAAREAAEREVAERAAAAAPPPGGIAEGPACGIGFELAFLLPALHYLRGRRRRG